MTLIKCPDCERFAEYDWDEDVKEGEGSLKFVTWGIESGEAWEYYNAVCPLCGVHFGYWEIYKFHHYETSSDNGSATYRQEDVNNIERRMATKTNKRRPRR